MAVLSRFLAGQFARPSGWVGRRLIAPWLDRISAETNRLATEALDLRPGDEVLEIGFGGGGLLATLLEHGQGRVVGIDLSAEMVARARRRFKDEKRLRLIHASVDSLPLPSASIDKACSVNNVYFWPDPARALTELARVVRPGGKLAIGFEPPTELRKWPGHRFGFRLYEESELRALMKDAGFTDFSLTEGRGRKPDYFLCLTGHRSA